ncbi:tRNA1(Val) (adenine(37)-N6)-methyltransferase [Selenomonas sp. TAMA-11512]|uniref:tRNA1(Val) (adenine(37)-N6)-methyltransferase n=1 Tax=Selenomonas sp. TAMA-11512 TaxID=3095337 RepID=UPI00308F443D|nr:tRNA1(Val) (adenine(37)-N6)-methyltransferase [Selenomonas sp. TAMA-11512]
MKGSMDSRIRQDRFTEARRAGERIDDLQHKGRFLLQKEAAFCFSLDAVLLAHFADLKKGEQILDLGTGTGVLPILLADAERRLHFAAIERQTEMAELAARNVELNALIGEIRVIEGDYREMNRHCARESFDVVLSNPPFFAVGDGRESPVESIAHARHEHTATLTDTLEAARYALKFGGRLYMIHRASRLEEIAGCLSEKKFALKRLRCIHPFADREADLILIEARKGGKAGVRIDPPFVVREAGGDYSTELKDYYREETV